MNLSFSRVRTRGRLQRGNQVTRAGILSERGPILP